MKKTVVIVIIMSLFLTVFSCSKKKSPVAPDITWTLTPTVTPTFTPTIVPKGSISGQIQAAPFMSCCYYSWFYPIVHYDASNTLYASNVSGGVSMLSVPTPMYTAIFTPVPTATIPVFATLVPAPSWVPWRPYGCPTAFPTPYQGALVAAMQGGVQKAVVTTGVDGRYLIDNLEPGVYNLKVLFPWFDVDYSMQTITVRASVESAEHNLTRSIDWAPGKLEVAFDPGVTQSQCLSIITAKSCTVDYFYYYFDMSSNTVYSYTVTIPTDKTPGQMQEIFGTVPETQSTFVKPYYSDCWFYLY